MRRLEAKLGGWTWREGKRAEARAALGNLARVLGEDARARCAAAYRAYRLTATPALAGEAQALLGEPYAAALNQVHSARRAGEAIDHAARRQLVELSEQATAAASDDVALMAAWAAIEPTGIGKAAARFLLPADRLAVFERRERKGWARLEARVIGAVELPARFRANPAQHFYAMLRDLEERRRNEWREALDQDPAAVELAA